jgi:hypothetical protein
LHVIHRILVYSYDIHADDSLEAFRFFLAHPSCQVVTEEVRLLKLASAEADVFSVLGLGASGLGRGSKSQGSS